MGQGDTPDPYFGPDTFVYGIHNLRYTPNGQFRQEIAPGRKTDPGPAFDWSGALQNLWAV